MSPLKILVLDDSEERLKQFKRNLIGHIVDCVTTAAEAIDKLSNESWQVVFLDHDLAGQVLQDSGDGTGYEVAEWLRDHEEKKPKLIIIHSFNTVGAKNMLAILPGAIYSPGCWTDMKFLHYPLGKFSKGMIK